MRILLVEDNEMNRDMLVQRLQRRGFSVLTAHDGAEGVELARRERPDLVLMDLSLPVMDGWEATRQLKSDPDTASIPIIALSAHVLPAERERALACGADAYATKPVHLPELLGLIKRLDPRRGPDAP
ncbi:MAG: response regulator [Bacteroidetes bacterium]|nr:response regulator [Rhodothermia bacterium]MCS7154685.1 response regulator [Bacteroidota bacterium]MCX7907158.1 response regulator [Bacteroidota bacterium]MDW8137478.1 response regulator [Bacteroidota bacterium]MDW8285568.1 response regulator [Bacteroidota bacterium]